MPTINTAVHAKKQKHGCVKSKPKLPVVINQAHGALLTLKITFASRDPSESYLAEA